MYTSISDSLYSIVTLHCNCSYMWCVCVIKTRYSSVSLLEREKQCVCVCITLLHRIGGHRISLLNVTIVFQCIDSIIACYGISYIAALHC